MAVRRDRAGEARFNVGAEVDAEQLRILKDAVRLAGKEARRSVRSRLKSAGVIVRDEIRSRTPVHQAVSYGRGKRARISVGHWGASSYKQRHIPGLLRKSTRLKIGSMSVEVFNNAKAYSRTYPGGYRYGKRLEFDPAFGYNGFTGSSCYAFFYPGAEAAMPQAVREIDKTLDDITRTYAGQIVAVQVSDFQDALDKVS